MFVVEQLDGKSSQTELQKYKGFVSRNNKLLQLEFYEKLTNAQAIQRHI